MISLDNQFASYSICDNLFKSYKSISDFLISEYFSCKPALFECYFFPNLDNEVHIVNMIRTCKKTLDIAIFCLTNDKIYAGIEEVFKRGIKVRIITDDECCKMAGSEIARCAAIGIPTKTDDSARANMHHKFAIIDSSVVVTGSFNWTKQAVKINQENILFFENKVLAAKYTEEYNRLWNLFTTVVDPKISILKVKEEEEKVRKKHEEKEKEKENKRKEREKEKESKKREKVKVNDKEPRRRLNFSPKKESHKSSTDSKELPQDKKKTGGCVIF
jgi:cardiolipin hydrolase